MDVFDMSWAGLGDGGPKGPTADMYMYIRVSSYGFIIFIVARTYSLHISQSPCMPINIYIYIHV